MVYADHISEAHLVVRLKDADALARAHLYKESIGVLAAVCRRYIANEEDVRDVLQECYIKIFTKIGSFTHRGNGSLHLWMTRIVVNQSISHLRKSNVFAEVDMEDEPLEDNGNPDNVDLVPPEALHEMIRRLPDGYRTVLNLYAIEGKSHKEIGELLGIKPKSSSSQFRRAKAMLAEMVKQYLKNKN